MQTHCFHQHWKETREQQLTHSQVLEYVLQKSWKMISSREWDLCFELIPQRCLCCSFTNKSSVTLLLLFCLLKFFSQYKKKNSLYTDFWSFCFALFVFCVVSTSLFSTLNLSLYEMHFINKTFYRILLISTSSPTGHHSSCILLIDKSENMFSTPGRFFFF